MTSNSDHPDRPTTSVGPVSPSQGGVDRIANWYTAQAAALDPILATEIGLPGHDSAMTDFSPDGHRARYELRQEALRRLSRDVPSGTSLTGDAAVTVAAMKDRLGLEQELYEADEYQADLNVITSPVQAMRDVFDLMPDQTEADWGTIAQRLAAVRPAAAGYIESLSAAGPSGPSPARRQFELAAEEAAKLSAEDSYFTALAARGQAALLDGDSPLGRDLAAAALSARQAYGELSQYLRGRIEGAPANDAFGRDRYALWSRFFVGQAVDLDEAYDWGEGELARLTALQEATARRISGAEAGVAEAVAQMDADPSRKLNGTAELRQWMQSTADQAIEALDGRYFDIPLPVRTLEAMIAPSQSGAIYYTGPSSDFSRPGRMWWSVPPGVEQFGTWREKTTVYHEGAPGHHLQIGIATAESDHLNDWRRLASWSSGYGEGWALYAEMLMHEFGFMDDLGDYLGLLDGQRMRAARVVFDIGIHLGKAAPKRWGGGIWEADRGWDFLKANVIGMPTGFLRFEWARYLGWAGQAPSYKLGQRAWEDLRQRAVRAAGGGEAALRDFHNRALRLGSLPLAVLPSALGLA